MDSIVFLLLLDTRQKVVQNLMSYKFFGICLVHHSLFCIVIRSFFKLNVRQIFLYCPVFYILQIKHIPFFIGPLHLPVCLDGAI